MRPLAQPATTSGRPCAPSRAPSASEASDLLQAPATAASGHRPLGRNFALACSGPVLCSAARARAGDEKQNVDWEFDGPRRSTRRTSIPPRHVQIQRSHHHQRCNACHWAAQPAHTAHTVRLGGIGTGISEANKRVPVFSFATQGDK